MRLISILVLIFIGLQHQAIAQEKEVPKLGLVLSGGGARGVAHIGIIKAMEEAGLRPDYIAGTSMGSIIAALYASGYSADQMSEIILEINWDQILSNKVPLNYIAFEEKEYYDRYLVGIPLSKKLKPQLGSGLLHGQMLTEVLHHYFWPTLQYDSFDDFPIPYRCIATDVNTGKAIVFEDGPLPTALRSSMAIPSVFTAMDFDTTLAVDGGVVNNFPVDIVREMGADYIIGINLGATSSGEAPDDLASIMMALASLPSKEFLEEHIEDCDVYIQPDLSGYSSSAFTKAPEILEYGLDLGKEHQQEFHLLAEKLGMNLTPFEMDSLVKPVVLNSINYKGNELFSNVLINKKLGLNVGDTVSREEMEEAIRRVYGINGFDKVEHEIHMKDELKADLELTMRERNPYQLYASVHADNIFGEGIVLNFTARDLLGKESRSIFTADISGNPRFRFDYYKYLSVNKKFAVNFRYDFANEKLPFYENGRVSDQLGRITNRIHLNILNTQSLVSSFSLGAFYENTREKSYFDNLAPEGIKAAIGNVFGVHVGWTRNNLNDRNFATSGSETTINIDNYFNTNVEIVYQDNIDSVLPVLIDDRFVDIPVALFDQILKERLPDYYAKLLVDHISFIPLGKRLSLVPRATLAFTLGENSVDDIFDDFRSGGWQRVWKDDIRVLGIQYNEVQESNIAVIGVRMQHLFFDNLFIKYGADLMGYHTYVPFSELSEHFDFEGIISDNLMLGYGAELTYRTVLGPISGGISFNTIDPHPRYYFALGFSFNYSD